MERQIGSDFQRFFAISDSATILGRSCLQLREAATGGVL